MRPFACHRFAQPDAVRIVVVGELDLSTVDRLDRALRRARFEAEPVVLDLRELQFIDSSGAHLLLRAAARIREAGGRLTVVRGPAAVDRLFALAGLDRRLDVVDDERELALRDTGALAHR
jgi:anti-sigma B factor antagonist